MNTIAATQFSQGWIKLFIRDESNVIALYTATIRAIPGCNPYNGVLCVVIGEFYYCSYPLRFLNSLPRNLEELSSARGYWIPTRMVRLLKKNNN